MFGFMLCMWMALKFYSLSIQKSDVPREKFKYELICVIALGLAWLATVRWE